MNFRSLLACTLLSSFASVSNAELVSYWPFDEFPDEQTTPDVVSGYDLELISDSGLFDADNNHVDGKIGKAFEFFSEDTSLFGRTHDEGDKLPINLQPEWTISMWAKVDGSGQNDLRLLSESNTQGNNDPLFNIGTHRDGTDARLDIYIRNGALSTPTVDHPWTEGEPFDGEWSHIGWTYADGMHNVFIDGAYDSSYPMESFGAIDPVNIDTTTIGGILRGGASHFVTGVIDEVAMWDEVLPGSAIAALAAEETTVMDAADFEGMLPPFDIAGRGEIGTSLVSSSRDNLQFGVPSGDPVSGLGQSWYSVGNPGSKAGVDAIFNGTERAVPYFQSEGGTWWSGSQDVLDVQNYPPEVEGVITGNQYSVKLEGEILIEESGTIQFLDGVDDYTYLAIDLDGNGTAGDSEDEVIIDDNAWTNALSTANNGAPINAVDFEGIADGGEWRTIEFNMAEGGGGDHGMLFWDFMDEDDFFPLDQGEGVVEEDAAIFLVPDSHLRSPAEPAPLLSGDVVGTAPTRESGWEFDVNPADGTADNFALENPDSDIFTTVLDVDGNVFHINPLGEVTEGTSFKILDADTIVGTPTIATDGWSFDASTGSVVFGEAGMGPSCEEIAASRIAGDADGSGDVGFLDFLALANNFGTEAGYDGGNFDCSGTVSFLDFLTLANNFGQSASASANSVPEPSGLALLGFALLCATTLRRRR